MKQSMGMLLVCLLLTLTSLAPAEQTFSPLPLDFTPGHVADESGFTESTYEDASISVSMERVWYNNAQFNLARVRIADPSQFRTAVTSKGHTDKVSTIARKNNAVVAIGGDYFRNAEGGYVVRMNEVFRKKPFKTRDMLLVDANGDFHIIIKSNAAELKALLESGVPMVNVFNFGPALVLNGELQEITGKLWNGTRYEPRCAIGQLGPLEYLLVVVDGRDADGSEGCKMTTLAQFMYDQGCVQAYNLDGGNSALMVFHGENYSEKSYKAERSVSDIIYFATAVDFGLDEGK